MSVSCFLSSVFANSRYAQNSKFSNMFHDIAWCCRFVLEKFLRRRKMCKFSSAMWECPSMLVTRCAPSCRRRIITDEKHKVINSRTEVERVNEHFQRLSTNFPTHLRGNRSFFSFVPICDFLDFQNIFVRLFF